jgi:ATP-dependent DNA helicase RecG
MDEDEKDRVMGEFRDRKLDVLVSTSVVEVGVDVPNATLMVVEHAERFGLSQLHQLRGRVSRGEAAGECHLFSDPTSEESRERLRALVRTADGFALAEEDARQRGLGQFFGTRQHGLGELRIANLMTDQAELQAARRDALALVGGDAGLRQPENELLRRTVLARYGGTLDLASIG